jgi:hypothetical protein
LSIITPATWASQLFGRIASAVKKIFRLCKNLVQTVHSNPKHLLFFQ